jgi:hypothetical protein
MTDRGPIIESGSAGAQLASGKVKATRAPPSARFSAQIRPPCACTRPCAIARPRPAPPLERARESSARQKRSNIRCGRVAVQSVTVVFVRDTGSVRLHVRFRGPVGRRRVRGQLGDDLHDQGRRLAGRPQSQSDGQAALCWIDRVHDLSFVSNTGSNTVSSFRVAPDGRPELVAAVAATMNPGTIDLVSSGHFLYVETGLRGTVDEFRVDDDGTLTSIGSVTGLPPGIEGIAAK